MAKFVCAATRTKTVKGQRFTSIIGQWTEVNRSKVMRSDIEDRIISKHNTLAGEITGVSEFLYGGKGRVSCVKGKT